MKRKKEARAAAIAAGKSKSSPSRKNSNEQKRSSTKNNRNRTSSSISDQRQLFNNPANLSTLLADIIQSENPEFMANTLADAAVVVNNKRERTKKHLEKKSTEI